MPPHSPIDTLKQRLDALRARSQETLTASRVEPRRVRADADAPRASAMTNHDPPSPRTTEEAHEHLERALDNLEIMSANVPGVRQVLELIERDADGRVTTASFARAAEALKIVSTALERKQDGKTATQNVNSPSAEKARPRALVVESNETLASAEKSPRIASPSGARRAASPIGPPRRVEVDHERREREAVDDIAEDARAEDFGAEDAGAEDANARLREWSEYVRRSKREKEMRDNANRFREDLIAQWRAFLISNASPSDPFVAALAEQWMVEAREKETMLAGVARARQMIEALAESDKIKTRTIDALRDELERAGMAIPAIAKPGIQWSEDALQSTGGVFGDDED